MINQQTDRQTDRGHGGIKNIVIQIFLTKILEGGEGGGEGSLFFFGTKIPNLIYFVGGGGGGGGVGVSELF